MPHKALIIVDVQNDFLPGGALPISKGDEVIPIINALMNSFDSIVATQDFHPKRHISFASRHNKRVGETIFHEGADQILWPDHCVQNSWGADFPKALKKEKVHQTFQKGSDPEIESYSGFFDRDRKRETGLEKYLREMRVDEVYIVGLATDYCVKYTALDAIQLGFKTTVIIDACRGVELNKGDIEKAIDEMKSLGVEIIDSKRLFFSTF